MANSNKFSFRPIGGWPFYFLFLATLVILYQFISGNLGIIFSIVLEVLAFAIFKLFNLRKYFGGFDLIKKMANEVGVDRQVFGTALTEVGVNYAFLKIEVRALMDTGVSEAEAVRVISLKNVSSVAMGLDKLKLRYPDEPMILAAQNDLKSYLLSRGAVSPYV